MRRKGWRSFAVVVAALALLAASPSARAAEKVRVVATQTLFADLVRQIGGDRVEVRHVAPPRFNVHFIQPKPSDVRALRKADLYVNAGLDLEAWSDPLVEAAGRPEFFRGAARSVDVSAGVELLKVPQQRPTRAGGDIHLYGNPHFTLDPRNARPICQVLVAKLKEVDPEGASTYDANHQAFLAKLDAKLAEWVARCAHCAGTEVLSYHDDVEYLADYLGLRIERFLEPKPGVPPTPRHLQELEAYARSGAVRAIVMPTYFPRETAESFGRRIGVPVVTVAQNVGEVEGDTDFFTFFDGNIGRIAEAVK